MKRTIAAVGLAGALITGAAGSALADHPKPDPQPSNGKDCEVHGNGGVNNDHCLATGTITITPSGTSTTTPSSTSSTTSSSTSSTTSPTSVATSTRSVNILPPDYTATTTYIRNTVTGGVRPRPTSSTTTTSATKAPAPASARPAEELALTGSQSLKLAGLAGVFLLAGGMARLASRTGRH